MITKEKNKDNIIKYTQHEIDNFQNGKVKIAKSSKDIDKFIKDSIKHCSNAKLYFGKIGPILAAKIKAEINIDIEDYNISLQANVIRHIFKNHGEKSIEKKRGQIAIAKEDFKLIPKIISEYDKLKNVGITENNNIAISFEKQIENKYFLITYISDKKHTLEAKTMWKIKARKKNSTTASDALHPEV